MISELNRRGYWARKNKQRSQLLEVKLNIELLKSEKQLESQIASTKFFTDIINSLKDSLFKLADEILDSNKQKDRMMKTIEGFLTTQKKVHEDPFHEKQDDNPKKDPPVHEKQKTPLSKKRKPIPLKGRKVRKKI